ncbi:bifunctional alpha/beta hydrolase/OsmC family protein [Pseudogemmobacter sp. W21_MBD1_M6]|uniref:bifunctional alpha/beta hydrolase/OsmC family protein n=1 Tax=Pseudogemmobacter sp. W21_MBD1_M6 TaxID=3240271 RepID=UPI003F96C6FD
MPTTKIRFAGHTGDMLAARLDLPEGPHLATALFVHCFTCSGTIPAARRIAGRLSGMGIAVLRFDFTGLGHSEGEFENTTFSSNVDDLLAAYAYLTEHKMPPTLLIGHSLGGAAILKAAGRIKTARAVVTIGTPFDPSHVTQSFAGSLPEIRAKGRATVRLGGRPFTINDAFLKDIEASSLGPEIEALKPALLVMHAPRDATVGIDNATRIFTAAHHPKSFVTLDNADHLISSASDAEYAAGVIAAWSARYIDLRPPAPPVGAPEGVVRVSEADSGGFLQDINAGPKHHTLADEPFAYGGTDSGMSPYGFLAAGLVACTSMTIRMYARRKGWPLDHVQVDVTHNKVHAQDAGQITDQKIDSFRRDIHLNGDLSDTQRQKLLQIADKCPVHQTLERVSEITTVLRDPAVA